jgi:hypothetical protein
MRYARIACVLAALVVSAWFALGVRQAIDTSRAAAIANETAHPTAAQVRTVASLARHARFLNPDKEPDVLLGQAEAEAGQLRRARAVLEGVTRSEPQNIEAWAWLARSAGPDLPLLFRAVARLHALEPRRPAP